jgi:selenocysteine-specific elongation factor
VLAELDRAGREPPSLKELATAHGARTGDVLRFLDRAGKIVQVEPERYYSAQYLNEILADMARGMADGQPRSPSDLRVLLGSSRKFLIPLLEYCDRRGLTERAGDGRVWKGP